MPTVWTPLCLLTVNSCTEPTLCSLKLHSYTAGLYTISVSFLHTHSNTRACCGPDLEQKNWKNHKRINFLVSVSQHWHGVYLSFCHRCGGHNNRNSWIMQLSKTSRQPTPFKKKTTTVKALISNNQKETTISQKWSGHFLARLEGLWVNKLH